MDNAFTNNSAFVSPSSAYLTVETVEKTQVEIHSFRRRVGKVERLALRKNFKQRARWALICRETCRT